MRQGQNRMRMRGRGGRRHNGGGEHFPSRVYESSGPDAKFRGTASHLVEKYLQLARDYWALGDRVAAENYNQHAEHYTRLVATFAEGEAQSSQVSEEATGEAVEEEEGFEAFSAQEGVQTREHGEGRARYERYDKNRQDSRVRRHGNERRDSLSRDGNVSSQGDRVRGQRQQGQQDTVRRPFREQNVSPRSHTGSSYRENDKNQESWGGHQPDFLRRSSVSDSTGAEKESRKGEEVKPSRSRRVRGRFGERRTGGGRGQDNGS